MVFPFLQDMDLPPHAHGALIKAGTRVIDVFCAPDRYPIKGG